MQENAPLKPKQSSFAPIRAGRQKVTFWSVSDLAETLKMAEQWHKANHLPAGEWAEEYAGYIFARQAEDIFPPSRSTSRVYRSDDPLTQADGFSEGMEGREVMNPPESILCHSDYDSRHCIEDEISPNVLRVKPDPEDGGSF